LQKFVPFFAEYFWLQFGFGQWGINSLKINSSWNEWAKFLTPLQQTKRKSALLGVINFY
jgi:hypothetical protein